jgi:hypothetical protein
MLLRSLKILLLLAILQVAGLLSCARTPDHEWVNSAGVRMIRIEPGTFFMGDESPREDSWDEAPLHEVTISSAFSISETEITLEQYRQFLPEATGSMTDPPYVTGLSWREAAAFCDWLTQKEGKPYRLPTEAEWEYAARAGTRTPFWSGSEPPAPEAPNPWGVKGVHSAPSEWCHDWYGPYPHESRLDPVGPAGGFSKVIRGGGLDRAVPYYARSSNRASYAPGFGMMRGTGNVVPESPEQPSEKPSLQGLIGVWYGRINLVDPKALDEITNLDLDWRFYQQPGQDRGEIWSARWEGFLRAPWTGPVTFHAASDRGMKLLLGGLPVIEWEGGEAKKSGTAVLEEGALVPLEVQYFHERGDKAYLRLEWSWAGRPSAAIPREALSYSPAQRKAMAGVAPRHYLPGHHSIGFRIVQAPLPGTSPAPEEAPFIRSCVVRSQPEVDRGPDPSKPWLRQRPLLTLPPVGASREEAGIAGLHPSLLPHCHNPGLEVMPNGDLLAVLFSSSYGPGGEDQPEVALLGTRLRFGSQVWDLPEPFVDFADVNDTSSLLWKEGDTVFHFWGHAFYDRAYPFQWMSSADSGATWTPVRFPQFTGEIGPRTNQPVSTVVRDGPGTLYLPSDGIGGTSVLWATDDLETWRDTGGRTFGRHTNIVLLRDGRILGMGGKNSNIDGYMPQSISDDGGQTWKIEKTPFPELGSGQRPALLRLAGGRLFFAGDLQHSSGHQPAGVEERGACVALSEDEGKTWLIKTLPGTLRSDRRESRQRPDHTLGYVAARQAPNGLIHMVTTKTVPPLHWELNEAWILSREARIMEPPPDEIMEVLAHEEHYPSGRLRARLQGGVTAAGEFRLHGTQLWLHENGEKQWEVEYRSGHPAGRETLRDPDGRIRWEREHLQEGRMTWRQFWPNGRLKSESHWRRGRAEGTARLWDPSGNETTRHEF